VAEHRNGKAGWFSDADRKVNITLITASDRLLTSLRPAISKTAASKLNSFGVDIVYNTRVTSAQEANNGRTTIILAKGDTLEADLYVPAHGVLPNSAWLPNELLDTKKYITTNATTLRVDAAGPRVYAFGDVASYSRNTVWDIMLLLPPLAVNMKRDLLAYNAAAPDAKPSGKDRLYTMDPLEIMAVPMGTQGGVGELRGWRMPSFFVWLIKGRDYMLSSAGETLRGKQVEKEVKWSREEAAI
jgi:NADH dehydrogenase FAD-containing subunit